jgi:hypothetical protein
MAVKKVLLKLYYVAALIELMGFAICTELRSTTECFHLRFAVGGHKEGGSAIQGDGSTSIHSSTYPLIPQRSVLNR